MTKQLKIAIIQQEQSMKSAVYGFDDLFQMANGLCVDAGVELEFKPQVVDLKNVVSSGLLTFDIVILPPLLQSKSQYVIDDNLVKWLTKQHACGAIITAVCAGCFALAATNIAKNRALTTHWGLVDAIKLQYPKQNFDIDKIIIDHGDIISAGGMMSWLDLGLHIVARFTSPLIMRNLGKILVTDTAQRQQSYYQQFQPTFSHGNQQILSLQHWLAINFADSISVKEMAQQASMTSRTLQRNFDRLFQLTPNQYLQRLRIQKACDLLESTDEPFATIAYKVGYQDVSAARKVFMKTMGLTPLSFRKRFVISG